MKEYRYFGADSLIHRYRGVCCRNSGTGLNTDTDWFPLGYRSMPKHRNKIQGGIMEDLICKGSNMTLLYVRAEARWSAQSRLGGPVQLLYNILYFNPVCCKIGGKVQHHSDLIRKFCNAVTIQPTTDAALLLPISRRYTNAAISYTNAAISSGIWDLRLGWNWFLRPGGTASQADPKLRPENMQNCISSQRFIKYFSSSMDWRNIVNWHYLVVPVLYVV